MAGSPHTFGSGSGMSECSGCECSSLSAASSDIGESASTVAYSRELDNLNHLLMIEVQDWLDKIIKDVIDALCCDSKCLKHRRTRYRQEEKVSAVSALEKLKKENEELKRLLGESTWAREKEREEKEKMITEAANTLFSPEAAPLFNGGQSSSMEVSATASSATEEQAEGELQRFRDEYDMNSEWA